LCFFLNSLDSCGESAEDDSDSDSWEYCDEDDDIDGAEDGEWEYYYEEIDTGHRTPGTWYKQRRCFMQKSVKLLKRVKT
jgi:hypothetical protein